MASEKFEALPNLLHIYNDHVFINLRHIVRVSYNFNHNRIVTSLYIQMADGNEYDFSEEEAQAVYDELKAIGKTI